MRATWIIARREIFSFFLSPIAYVTLVSWLFLCGVTFWLLVGAFSQQPGGSATANPLSVFFGGSTLFYIMILVFPPILTMRLLAEEKSNGTIETLMTAPVSEVSIVLGKYIAAMFFWSMLWVPTLAYVWISAQTGEGVVDPGVVASSYLGVFSVGVFYMAVGLLMSAVARTQIAAALLTFMVLTAVFILGLGGFVFPDEKTQAIFEYIGVWSQMGAFAKGIVDTRYLVYDFSLATLCVFLAVRVVQTERLQ